MPAIASERQPKRLVKIPLAALIANVVPVDKDKIILVEVNEASNVEARVVEKAP